MTKYLFLLCFVYIIVIGFSQAQFRRWCRNTPFQSVIVENITHNYSVNLNISNDNIQLLTHIHFDVFIPEGFEVDGFVFHMQLIEITHAEPSLVPTNICHPGYDHFWVKTDNTTCLNATSVCGKSMDIPAGYRICPYKFNTLLEDERSCWGTGDRFVNRFKYITVPSNIRDLVFNVEFRASYFFQVHPYFREFFSMVQPSTNGKQIFPLLNCPSAVHEFTGKGLIEATELCCEKGISHNNVRNITFRNFVVDYLSYTVNYTVRWLPPISQDGIRTYVVTPHVDHEQSGFDDLHTYPAFVKTFSTFRLDASEIATLASCDNTTVYHETELLGLVPGVVYKVQISTIYEKEQQEEYRCDKGHCVTSQILPIEAVDVCDSKHGYCVEQANCTSVDPTGKTSLNATCTCPKGYAGNGVNDTKLVFGSGCSNVDYCIKELTSCANYAMCDDFLDDIGANCSCGSGYFGDGYKNGTGCTSISTVALSVAIPSVMVIGLIVGFAVWKLWKRRARLEDIKWSQFVANDALKTYNIKNMLNGGEEDVCVSMFGDKWEIDRAKVTLGKVLGRGNYGVVYRGTYEEIDDNGLLTETSVAVKTVKEGSDEDTHTADFLAEIGFMLNVGDHPSVLKVIGCCTTQKPVLLITDLLKYGDLLHFLWEAREPSKCLIDPIYYLTEKSLYEIAKQVAEGMDYLTQSRIIHGDLAARNILVGENLACKISDFGLANDVYRYGIIKGQSERCVPFKWISPERMMAGKVPITSKSDVWSFGNLMYETVTLGCTPHPGVTSENLFELLKGGYRMKQPSTCSNEMFAIMWKCWKWRPSSRPSFANLVQLIDREIGGKNNKAYVNLSEAIAELNEGAYENEMNLQQSGGKEDAKEWNPITNGSSEGVVNNAFETAI